jgi:hypothetical protein
VSGFSVSSLFNLLDEFFFEQALDGAIQGSGAQPHASAGLLLDLAHDAVTVQIFVGQGEQNLKGSRGQWIEFSFWHICSTIDISMSDYIRAHAWLSNAHFRLSRGGINGLQKKAISCFLSIDRSEPGFPDTRHSPTATCAAFSEESRMKFDEATNLDRKSGEAQRRDLLFRLFCNKTRFMPPRVGEAGGQR